MKEDIFSVNADLTALRELEETLKGNPDKEWLEYEGKKWIKEDYVIPKSKIKEKIEELDTQYKEIEAKYTDEQLDNYDVGEDDYIKMEKIRAAKRILQDLLGEEK